jgi:ribosomal peptide maturation radical SAM protein 1
MEPRVALVSMPWAPISEPSLALAILKAQLAREGVHSRVFHSSLGLLRHVTGAAYQQMAMLWGLDEFTFSGVLDEGLSQDQADCLMERCFAHSKPDSALPFRTKEDLGRALIRMRHEIVPQYLAECAEEILAYQPTMVGMTCMFDQTLASTALALLIRQQHPEIQIVCGGYALEGPPGLEVLRAFPPIDAVAAGDGEPIIAALAHASVGRIALSDVPGVLTRENPSGKPRQRFELEASPDPDYSDWYGDLAAMKARDKITITTTVLPIESSRGCWWGQKQHCVFCGIDEVTLAYRTKKAATVLDMLGRMRERYGADTPFRFSDYILPHNFIGELLPKLAQVEPRYELHCEIKANQSDDRIQAFAEAGFSELQPGIESFDSNVLRLMTKGVTGIANVHLLKLGYVYGVQINYNVLYGLPGERPDWYRRMIELVPRLYHLTPPVTRTETIVTRFAPLHTSPQRFGLQAQPRHHRCYDTLFSQEFLQRTGFSLDDYAYYFERYFRYHPEAPPLYWTLVREIDHWKKQHLTREVVLSWETMDDESLRIRDTRFAEPGEIVLGPLESRVYLACDRAPKTLEALARDLDVPSDQTGSAVESLDRAGLVWREGEQVLGLAVPAPVVERHRERGWHRRWTSLYS